MFKLDIGAIEGKTLDEFRANLEERLNLLLYYKQIFSINPQTEKENANDNKNQNCEENCRHEEKEKSGGKENSKNQNLELTFSAKSVHDYTLGGKS